jgi:hypothetical protein
MPKYIPTQHNNKGKINLKNRNKITKKEKRKTPPIMTQNRSIQ